MKSIQEGYLQVDDLHQIYYHRYGNLSGTTILFVHGGPGLGTNQKDLDFFDLEKVNVILFDQRACGKSTPKAELQFNDTQAIIEDMAQLLDYLEVDKVVLFGGSWGSTLSLLFGILHPNRVKGMLLRGVFTAAKKERMFFEEGGTQLFYPKAWQRLIAQIPDEFKHQKSQYYFKQILGADKELSKKLSYELLFYGMSVSRLKNYAPQQIEKILKESDYETKALLLAHYSYHDFFLPDNYILNHLDELSEIPIHIVQGQYDMITTPQTAVELKEKLSIVSLCLVEAGHATIEKKIFEQIQSELQVLLDQC